MAFIVKREPPPMSVSTTSSINLFDPTYSYQTDTYLKVEGYNNFTDDGGITTTNQFGQTINGFITKYVTYFAFNVTTNRWEFGVYEDSLGEGTLVWSSAYPNLATNPSTNRNVIPTTGWSRSLTLTPNGIPVASTQKIIVSNVMGIMFGVQNNGAGSYSKSGYYSGSGPGSSEESIYYTLDTDHNAKIVFFVPRESAPYWYVGYNNDNEFVYAVNPSTDGTHIPTSGWSEGISITSIEDMSLIIKRNTTLKISRTGSGAPAPSEIHVTTNKIIVNGGNAGTSNVTLTRNDTSIPLCNYGGSGSSTYTFDAKWEGVVNGAVNWGTPTGDGYVVLGIATRKFAGGSGESFISFNNCTSGSTEAVAPTWVLFVYSTDEYGNSGYTYATNPSQDFNNVPKTGWVVHRAVSSITITAFEIPISTQQITLLSPANSPAMPPLAVGAYAIYNKQSDTEWWWGSDYYLRYDGRWYFVNEDISRTSYHPTATNPNFIPDTGWDDGIVITSGINVSNTENIVIGEGTSDGPNWHRGTYTKTSGQVIYMVDEEVRFKFTPSTEMYWFGNVRGFLLIPPNCSVFCEWYSGGGYDTYTTTIEAFSTWRLISFSNIEDNPSIVELNRNPSTNTSFIPKINWSAPSISIEAGLLAATTTSITMSFENSPSAFNGTYTRVSQGAQIISGPGQGAETQSYILSGGAYLYRKPNFVIDQFEYENGVLCPPNSTIRSANANASNMLNTPFSTWTLVNLYLDNDYGWTSTIVSTNPSTDPTIIPIGNWPISNWTNGFSLTAPSGIPEPPVGRAMGDLYINFGSTGDVRNGVWYRQGIGDNIAWNNPVYGRYPLLVPPGFYYNTAQTWTFWNSDQSRPQAPSNSSTNPNFIPTIGWEESSIGRIGNLTITPINYIDVGASVSIFARPDNSRGYAPFAHFPRFANGSGFAFGPYTNSIIQWNENYPPHWEIRGDNQVLEYILASPSHTQTTGRIPEIGTWYSPQYFRYDTLYFEGSQYS